MRRFFTLVDSLGLEDVFDPDGVQDASWPRRLRSFENEPLRGMFRGIEAGPLLDDDGPSPLDVGPGSVAESSGGVLLLHPGTGTRLDLRCKICCHTLVYECSQVRSSHRPDPALTQLGRGNGPLPHTGEFRLAGKNFIIIPVFAKNAESASRAESHHEDSVVDKKSSRGSSGWQGM